MNNIIPRLEAMIRRVLDGALTIQALIRSWDDVGSGNVTFQLSSGDRLMVFNDCDSYDYIEAAMFADGEVAGYRDINAWDREDISGRFSQSEWERFESILKAATVVAPERLPVDNATG